MVAVPFQLPVTQEVASSSLVGPAIIFQHKVFPLLPRWATLVRPDGIDLDV
jgi:hypothetical protein